jgi:hypothetical protein
MEKYMNKGIVVIALLVLIAGFAFPAVAEGYLHLNLPEEDTAEPEFGGISSEANNPPTGTMINEELSKYYGVPVATRNMEIKWVKVQEYLNGDFENVITTIKPVIVKSVSQTKYFYISGWWFTQDEMAKLPVESLMYKQSPYAITDIE